MRPVLVVGAGAKSTQAIMRALRAHYQRVSIAANLGEALHEAARRAPLAVIVDCSARRSRGPGLHEHLAGLRRVSDTPVLAVVSPDGARDSAFLETLDDFVRWPLHEAELRWRLARLLRRGRQSAVRDVVRHGALTIDMTASRVTLGGRPIELTYKEYRLLLFLATHPGRVFTRQQLVQEVWLEEHQEGTRKVDMNIRRLRNKLASPRQSFIRTARKEGYWFDGMPRLPMGPRIS